MKLVSIRAPKAIVVCMLAAIVTGIAPGNGTAQAPTPVPKAVPNPRVPPQLRNLTLTNQSMIVSLPQLGNGQTISQVFSPNPPPRGGLMVVSGTWPIAVYGGGEGQLNRKIRAILISPFGQTVADGCGYSGDVNSGVAPKLLTTGQFNPGTSDAVGQWKVNLNYCDGYGNGDGVSPSLGQVRISVSYNAP